MKFLAHTIALLLLAATCNAQTLHLNTSQSRLSWTGSAAVGSYSLSGTLTPTHGKLTKDGNTVATAAVAVDMTTLAAENKDLQGHLRSADFFDVKRFRQARFQLTEAFDAKEGQQTVRGQLTIKDQNPKTIGLEFLTKI